MEQQPTPQNDTSAQTLVVNRRPIGFAVTSMVLGIISVVLMILWPLSIPLAIIALIFGIISLVKKRGGKGMSIAGIATGGTTLLIMLAILAFGVAAYVSTQNSSSDAGSRQDDRSSLFND